MSWTLVSSLRGVLRFLFLEGLTACDLTGAVPGVAKWRAASLPKALRAEDVARVLASRDRTTAVGRRDFAILTVLSRLGLRAWIAGHALSDSVDFATAWSAREHLPTRRARMAIAIAGASDVVGAVAAVSLRPDGS